MTSVRHGSHSSRSPWSSPSAESGGQGRGGQGSASGSGQFPPAGTRSSRATFGPDSPIMKTATLAHPAAWHRGGERDGDDESHRARRAALAERLIAAKRHQARCARRTRNSAIAHGSISSAISLWSSTSRVSVTRSSRHSSAARRAASEGSGTEACAVNASTGVTIPGRRRVSGQTVCCRAAAPVAKGLAGHPTRDRLLGSARRGSTRNAAERRGVARDGAARLGWAGLGAARNGARRLGTARISRGQLGSGTRTIPSWATLASRRPARS